MKIRSYLSRMVLPAAIATAFLAGCSGGSSMPSAPGSAPGGPQGTPISQNAPPPTAEQLKSLKHANFSTSFPAGMDIKAPSVSAISHAIAARSGNHPNSTVEPGGMEVVGASIPTNDSYTGIVAEHSAYNNTQFTLAYPPGATGVQALFAPAMAPPNGGCFADSTVAINTGTANQMFFAVFNGCGSPGFVVAQPIDATFQNNFAYINSDGRLVYKTMIYTPDSVVGPNSGWVVLIWNPNTSTWNFVTSRSGSTGFMDGFSIWLTVYQPGPCSGGSLSIVADHIALLSGGAGPGGSSTLLSPSNSTIVGTGDNCFQNDSTGPFSNQFILGRANDYWRVARNLSPQLSGCTSVGGINGFYPCDLQRAYKLPSNTNGVGQTVAIVDAFDDPTAEADLHVYRAQFGLPTCTTANGCFKKVNQSGNPTPLPSPNAGWAAEISLDLDMVSAACPNCHILLVEGNSNSFADLAASVDTAAATTGLFAPTAISNSYGQVEFSGPTETSHNASYAHPGIAITVSSGDGGYDLPGNFGAPPYGGPQWPAALTTVIAVGGTSLYPLTGTPHNAYENAWDAAGSGCSLLIPKPAWQSTLPGCPNRVISDVSAVADPLTGVAVYTTTPNYHWAVFGGTSASSPLIAAAYGLNGSKGDASLNNAASIYAHAANLFDVVGGSNTSDTSANCPALGSPFGPPDNYGGPYPRYICAAVAGYDGPTGLGTPNGVAAFGNTPAFVRTSGANVVGKSLPIRDVPSTLKGRHAARVCSNAVRGFARCYAWRLVN